MINGSTKLDLMVGSQKPYFGKTVPRYEKEDNEKSSKDSQNKFSAYIYCFKRGHSSKICTYRRKAKQKVKNPKKSTNTKGPKKIWVLKVKNTTHVGVS